VGNTSYLDDDHSSCLCDVGGDGYAAATAVAADGSTHLLLAQVDAIGDDRVTYDPTCQGAAHEQTGPLPLEFVRRLTIARRRGNRCGRRTKSGTVCRMRVSRAGDACDWHRSGATL
jgi:hypothetical protein